MATKTELTYTPLEEIDQIHATLRAGHNGGKLRSLEYRKYQLLQLGYLVKDSEKRFEEALKADLGRPALESYFLEINAVIGDVKTAFHSVEKWAKPEKPPFQLNFAAMRPIIYKEPKGIVLIITPFNYPLWLAIPPVAGAIAAGNSVLLKPSESSKAVSALFAELVPKYMDPDILAVINGAIPETTRLLELPWDHILYTGSGRVGKIVAAAAAKFLTPVTLELGGKSPVIIDPNCDLETAARRILWGKVVNAGQTCVAPDYILVPKTFQDNLIEALIAQYKVFYPEGVNHELMSTLITPQAFKRVKGLLDATKGEVIIGGETVEEKKFIAPTIVKDVTGEDSLMSEEIFGPILPILPVSDVDEAIAFITARDHPLALYVFSKDEEFKRKVFQSTKSGAAVANETLIHCGAEGLPVGGIGPSGYGQHTGKFSFDTFTHLRSSIDSPSWIDKLLGFRFPPYTIKKLKTASITFGVSLPPRPSGPPAHGERSKGSGKWFLLLLAVAIAGGLTKRIRNLTMGTSSS